MQSLRKLKDRSPDVVRAYEWLEQNRNLFRDRIFGPVCMEIAIADPSYADAVETLFSTQLLTMFVCQNQQDYDRFMYEVSDARKLRVTATWSPTRLDTFTPPCSREDLGRMGFECWAIDQLKGPEPVLAALCDLALRPHTVVGFLTRRSLISSLATFTRSS